MASCQRLGEQVLDAKLAYESRARLLAAHLTGAQEAAVRRDLHDLADRANRLRDEMRAKGGECAELAGDMSFGGANAAQAALALQRYVERQRGRSVPPFPGDPTPPTEGLGGDTATGSDLLILGAIAAVVWMVLR